jgi:hypothetical protein
LISLLTEFKLNLQGSSRDRLPMPMPKRAQSRPQEDKKT